MKGDRRRYRTGHVLTRPWWTGAALAVLILSGTGLTAVWAPIAFEQEPINYLNSPVDDPVARLQAQMDLGQVQLAYDDKRGYLPAVLDQLGVSETSQSLVFSKTSFQHTRISPRTPRAIYFGDDVYIGWVRGGDVLEISAVDPQQGAVFYTLDQSRTARPTFERQTHTCLSCHASPRTQGVPGHLVRSVYPDAGGMPVFNAGTFVTGHESPLEERWGGWYVTGTHGDQVHMGNVVVRDKEHPERLDTETGANLTDLSGLLSTEPYLTDHSDIVGLMVLEHQTQMHNRITATSYQTRLALYQEAGINKALGRPSDALSESTRRRIERSSETLLNYLLFVDEAPLTAPIAGTSGFAEQFEALGPRDRQGRSLRDFDLQSRLFRYPCSYLIYSEAFNSLPKLAKDYIDRRLLEILTHEDQSPEYAHLSSEDRDAILEILRDTKPDLPADWYSGAP